MSSSNSADLARIVAEGFFAVYVKEQVSDSDRINAIVSLADIFRKAAMYSKTKGELDAAEKLHGLIGTQTEVSAAELRKLIYSLSGHLSK